MKNQRLSILVMLIIFSYSGFSQNSDSYLQMRYDPDGVNVTSPKFESQSDLNLVSFELLKKYSFKDIRDSQIGGYRLLIGSDYIFNSQEELRSVLERNKAKIQVLINKVNKHADTPLSAKEILSSKFPKAFFFRKPEQNIANQTFSQWDNEYSKLGGICSKAMREEIFGLNEEKIENYFNRFALENPEQLVLLHFNGKTRDPKWRISKFSAGHWVYYPGCDLTKNITAGDSILYVSDDSVFKTGIGINGAKKNDDIVIVPLDNSGRKLWDEAEQVTLVSKGSGAIKVLRGRYGTNPRSFKSGMTYLAPHAVEGPWGHSLAQFAAKPDKDLAPHAVEDPQGPSTNNLLWYYNLASNCPKDKDGNQCADIWAKEIGSWFAPDGELFAFDGIQFDIAPWSLDEASYDVRDDRYADIDMDGKKDCGWIGNVNVFGTGVEHFYQLVRQQLGSEKLILADGGDWSNQRAVDVINGMESEGLCAPNDVYKEFSKPLSLFNYWLKNGITPQFSYVTHKDKMEGTEGQKANRERMVFATAQCMGVGVNTLRTIPSSGGYGSGIPDELVKGVEDKLYWLGSPKGPMIDIASLKEPLKSFSINQVEIEGISCQYNLENEKLILISTNNSEREMKVVLKNVSIPTGDLVVYFDAKAKSSVSGFNERIPRHVSVRLKGRKPSDDTADEVLNYIGCIDYSPCSFYFRNAGPEKVDVEITIEGGGEVEINNLRLVNETQALAREFENGLVLVNPSLKEYIFDLSSLFPDKSFKRLTATKRQDIILNNGEKVGKTVKVSPLNGLFLIKM